MTRDRAPPPGGSPGKRGRKRPGRTVRSMPIKSGSGEKVEPKEFKSSSKPLMMMLIELDEGRGGSKGDELAAEEGFAAKECCSKSGRWSSIGVSLQRIIPQS